jgi:myo-inositol-1(or 4)-monophosphatase
MPNSLALRMALVAAGEAEAMVDGRASHEWDVAAASLLVTEAGGLVSTRDGGPLAFNKPLPDVAGLVCAAPGHHGPMQARLQQLLDALATRRQGVRPPKHVQNDR